MTTCHRIDCATPITGTPVVDPDDLMGREFCRDECLTAEAEAGYERQYQPGDGDRAFLIADEDVDFADEWDDGDSNRYQDRVEAGLEPGDGSDRA